MRPTDFCFPSLDYEHPYLVGFRARHWDSRPTAATEDSVFHDTDVPLRRALRFRPLFSDTVLRGVLFPATARNAEPLTSLSPPPVRLRMGL